ncbi:hypothetical protein G4G27_02155 [Sphingomonas sp. So64.6b]|uniref:hypothetical protein n=1 Tax=Sphingomonas sp. So64.6b TaxID=2997354 RepID=UPI0015FFA054|nr:hypothetical protein [Sphingomonas sp. So64.6b]QNA82948.1 hypothetical protein G4G27_02155 [Sphingomonas sp. So64.6b]
MRVQTSPNNCGRCLSGAASAASKAADWMLARHSAHRATATGGTVDRSSLALTGER